MASVFDVNFDVFKWNCRQNYWKTMFFYIKLIMYELNNPKFHLSAAILWRILQQYSQLPTDGSQRFCACHHGGVQVFMCGWNSYVQPHSGSVISSPLLPARCASGSPCSQLHGAGTTVAQTTDSCKFNSIQLCICI